MYLSAGCTEQAHLPPAAGEQCAMHSLIGPIQWAGTSQLKSAPSCGGSGPPSITWHFGPSWVSHPNGIAILIQPFLQGSPVYPTNRYTDRHTQDTDHAIFNICSNEQHLYTLCRWCDLIIIIILYTFLSSYGIGNIFIRSGNFMVLWFDSGHLDSRTSIQRVISVTFSIALAYSLTQVTVNFSFKSVHCCVCNILDISRMCSDCWLVNIVLFILSTDKAFSFIVSTTKWHCLLE